MGTIVVSTSLCPCGEALSIFENDALIVRTDKSTFLSCFKSPFRDKSPSPPYQLNIWRRGIVVI